MIISCPECGHQVSDQAETCPSCGIRIAKKKKMTGTIVFIIAIIMALVIVFLGFYFYKTQETENEQHAYENAMRSELASLKKMDAEWANALMSGSRAELEKYVMRHPNSVHNIEAKLQIDSLDWVAACQADTPEAYQSYIDAHYDGAHYDEARRAYDHLDAQQVKAEDKELISTLFSNYFRALSERDEGLLTATLANVLTSFLHKQQATKTDVMQYMHKLYEEDVAKINYTLNNDWKINKKAEEDGQYSYNVDFSVDQKIDRSDASKERFCTFKVQAKISPEGKISELNMKKIVQ